MSRTWVWLSLRDIHPDVVVAQYRELKRQIPLLYSLLTLNFMALSYTHYGLAPDWQTLGVPSVLILLCLVRVAVWMRRGEENVRAAQARRRLRSTTLIGAALTLLYIWASLGIADVGGPYEQSHLVAFVGITVTGCIFCLMHLPPAAMLVTVVAVPPYAVFCIAQDNPVLIAISFNVVLLIGVMLRSLQNSYASFAGLVLSRAETERLSRENARLAHTDALSGLPNRRLFFAELDAHVAADDAPLAVALVDLDHFKPVNDVHGHVAGDRLLAEVGARLRAAVGEGVLVARLGGDEFGLLFETDGREALLACQRICAALLEPFDLGEAAVSVGGSCGVAAFPDGGRTSHALFDHADYALYASKTSGRGKATLYSAEHQRRLRTVQAVESALQGADLDAEMDLHLQPIVDGETGSATAVEALARWTSPSLGAVAPDVFIPVAERSGLIHALTPALFRKAADKLAALPESVSLSFNLSAQDVTNPKTVLALLSILRQSGVAPRRLVFELTETAMMRDIAVAEASIRLLRASGARFALDDFGVGQSSLGALHRLPLDMIKVDRSFVRGLGEPAGRNLIASIVALTRSMQLDCVFEGVETPDELETLRALGCRRFQGYHFAAPMPLPALRAWIASREEAAQTGRAAAMLA